MSDSDLDKIRQARLQQLQSQSGQTDQDPSAAQQQQNQSDARASMLTQILFPEASDRLGRIRLVNPSRATQVEDRLINLARSGQLRERVTEAQLKELLSGLSEMETSNTEKLRVQRRRGWDDDDDDELEDLMTR